MTVIRYKKDNMSPSNWRWEYLIALYVLFGWLQYHCSGNFVVKLLLRKTRLHQHKKGCELEFHWECILVSFLFFFDTYYFLWNYNFWKIKIKQSKWVECSPMVRETWFQSQVTSHQRLLKWFLIPPCLTLSNIRYVSRVKWSNPGKGVVPSPTPRSTSRKGSLLVALDYGRQLYLRIIIIEIIMIMIVYVRASQIFNLMHYMQPYLISSHLQINWS